MLATIIFSISPSYYDLLLSSLLLLSTLSLHSLTSLPRRQPPTTDHQQHSIILFDPCLLGNKAAPSPFDPDYGFARLQQANVIVFHQHTRFRYRYHGMLLSRARYRQPGGSNSVIGGDDKGGVGGISISVTIPIPASCAAEVSSSATEHFIL